MASKNATLSQSHDYYTRKLTVSSLLFSKIFPILNSIETRSLVRKEVRHQKVQLNISLFMRVRRCSQRLALLFCIYATLIAQFVVTAEGKQIVPIRDRGSGRGKVEIKGRTAHHSWSKYDPDITAHISGEIPRHLPTQEIRDAHIKRTRLATNDQRRARGGEKKVSRDAYGVRCERSLLRSWATRNTQIWRWYIILRRLPRHERRNAYSDVGLSPWACRVSHRWGKYPTRFPMMARRGL